MSVSFIVLAAGKGSRMLSDLPKVLHKVAGAPLLHHALATAQTLEPKHIIVVTGHEADAVSQAAKSWDETIQTVLQSTQDGTGHAVAQAAPILQNDPADAQDDIIILYGDTPFIQPETLEKMQAARTDHDVVVLGFHAADPGRYGRLVIGAASPAPIQLERIVEWKDASPEERAITLCNSGVICAASQTLFDLVAALGNNNAAQEYYLTDIVAIARARGLSAGVVLCDEAETLGINDRAQLAQAEASFQKRARETAFENGVTLTAPDTVFFAHDTAIGRDAIIGQNVIFGPGVTIESGAEILPFCHLEGCHVSQGARIGPFARLRHGAEIAGDARVGNFVEIKNTQLGEGAKVGHLTYLGDADVGAAVNIGAGTITCNYDGVMKHRTQIGAEAFIGSNTMLIAPVTIGAGALTASGSAITKDVPAGALALARADQINKPGVATRLFERLRALKARNNQED